MLKMTVPVRQKRASYRRELAELSSAAGPYLSLYVDVRPDGPRDEARKHVLAELDRVVSSGGQRMTAEQWSAAGDVLNLVTEDDATLVSLIDAAGQALTTGYENHLGPTRIELADRPLIAPLLAAEQALVHHVVAVIGDDHLILRTAPRHGRASQIRLAVADPADLPAIIQRTARVSRTAMVVVCASPARLVDVSPAVRSGLPIEVRMASVETDGRTAEQIEDEIAAQLAAETERKTNELVDLWRFHQVHGEAVDGWDDVSSAVADGRVGLLLIGDSIGEDLIWSMLDAERPVHVLTRRDHGLRDQVGAILADRAEPEQLAALLER